MKTLTTIKAWILLSSLVVTSSATIEHASSHHDVSQHGDSIPQKKHQNTIVPFGIQIPGHVLSTQDVACISADSNIFEIMNKAQETCNGTDMRCTFYHFVNHGYQNIGTLDVDKNLFNDLLMKFDNWLLTAENIEKNNVPLDGKTKEDSSLDTESNSNASETERLYKKQGVRIDKADHNTNESDDDKIVNTHHIIFFNETHNRTHHHKLKNGNHITLIPEYNNGHRYFEVFLPKDKETGKPRTIYVEVDKDKNEFVLLDEEIDKKLNGVKPIRIELDELSEIADTAFSNIPKSLSHIQNIYSSNDDDRIITGNINTHSAINKVTTNLDTDVEEPTPNTLNSSVCNSNICNIHANQQLIPDNMTGNVKKILNVSKNLVVPNIYINQAQFYVESQIDNTTDEIANNHLGFLESTNETDIYQTGFYKETPLDTTEFNENNTSINLDLDNIEYSLENFDIPCENDYDNSTENYELTAKDENLTFDDDSFIELEENNDTSIDIDLDDTHDFSSSNKLHLNEPILQVEKPMQENNLKSFPYIYTEPKLASSLTAGISELDEISSENRQGSTDLQDHSEVPSTLLSPYTAVPIFEKDLVKVLEKDGNLQSSFPAYATLDFSAGSSQNTPLNSDIAHTSISSVNSPLKSDFGHQTTGHKISTIFPTPPVECVVRLIKGSKYSPLNFGFSWLPSHSRIEELRLPSAVNSSPKELIMSLPSSLDNTTPVEEPRLIQNVPSLSVDIQEPSLTIEPYHLDAETIMPPKPILPSKLGVANHNTDFDRIHTTYPLSETPLSVTPYKTKDVVYSPCPIQQVPSYLQPTKPNLMELGLIKYLPFDNNSKETMIPCSPCKNRYPYTTIPYFLNPYLKPQYLEPLMPVAPLQPAFEIPTLDSLPISLDQSYPYIKGDYPRETKPISLLPNTAFPPLYSLLPGPGFVPNTLPCQNLWNNIPYLPSTILSDQNIRNFPPIVNNYLTPSAALEQNQILKPLLSKAVPNQPCPVKNILEMISPSYAPFSPVHTSPIQMDLSPSLALERDLQSLSLKYGIPLSKLLNSLEKEIIDVHSKTCSPTFEVPYSNLIHDSSLISKPIFSKTNAVLDDESRSGYEELLLETDHSDLVPLDSSLIGPHLEIESSLMPESNDSQNYTVLSDTISENIPTTVIHDSSLIGPHLSSLSTSNFMLSDESRVANEMVISESDISNLIPINSSLIGPHLKIGSLPIVLDAIDSQGDINKSHTEVPVTISSQTEPKLNIQNQPTNVLLDSSLIGSHLPSLAPVKPLLSDELQTINDMIPLETDLTDLTPLDSSIIDTQDDFLNKLQQLEILKHEKTAVTLSAATVSSELHKPSEYLPANLVEEELLLESDSSQMIPLDSSLIGPDLKLGSSPIIIDSLGDKTIPLVSKENLQNIDNKVEELESIILPSPLLPTLLNKPVKADSNLNIITQETKLNEKLDETSLDSNVEQPFTNISLIPFKEKDFKIVEPILELPSLIDDRNIPLLTEDSRTLEYKSKLSDMTHVIDSETQLDSSLVGASILHKLAQPEVSTSLDSSIHLDSSLIGPSILQEIDSREISPILDSVNQLQSSLAATTINQTKKPSEILTSIDFSAPLESSLKGSTVHHEINSQEIPTEFDSVTKLDKSLVPSLHEIKESSATSHVFGSKSQLDSSLKSSSLHQETLKVSRAFASKDLLDSSLIGPNLSTIPFSSDEIKMINEELQPKSGLENFVPLDSSLVGPHVDFESDLEQSEISRYQNPETSLLTVINPGVSETTELPRDLIEGMSLLEPITLPSTDQQELLSKFANANTKSQLLPSELKPCDKLLSSIAKISSDISYVMPSCKELQTSTLNTIVNTPLSLQDELASKLSPITMTSPAHELSPVGPLVPCLESNNFPTPKTLTELPTYAQGVPQITFTPYSPFVQMKPFVDRNWQVPQTLNNQNILQTSPSFRPVVENPSVPFFSNALIPLTSEDFQPLLDLASHSNLCPQLSISNMYTPGGAIAPSSEWTTPSYNLPLDKYIPLLPKKNSPVLPSNLKSTISNSEYNPIVVDDNLMSLLDENSFQLLKHMSVLPFSQFSLAPTISMFEEGEIVSPSLLDTIPIIKTDYIKTRPLLPISITNSLVPSSIYNPQVHVYNPQNIPYMIQTPNISPCNLQPYSNIPLHSQFSEIIEPAPKLVTVPTESPKAFLQQLLSKPCVESPISLPSSSLDTMLQLPTASNELNSVPCQSPPEYFTPISPICTNTLSNAFTNPILPIYASPLSVPFAKPISTPSTSLPLNVPYADGPLIPLPLPINPNTARPLTPMFSSPFMPLKITPISDYPYPPTVAQNRPMPSENSYKPFQIYSSPYVPFHASPIPIDTSPSSANIMSKLPPAMTSPVTPVFYEPLSTPYFSPLPKILTNLGLSAYSGPLAPISLSTLAPAPTGLLSPSYLSLDRPTYSYSSLPATINSQTCPSNLLTPAYITPISPASSSVLSYNTRLSLNPKITTLPLKSRLLNTLPIQSYFSHIPKSTPLSNLQIKQNIPLIEEIPSYDVIEESACTYSNDKDDKSYQESNLKYPLESLSYTLAPEEITEASPSEDFIKQEDVTPPVNNCASEPSLQKKLYQHLCLKPYASLYGTRKPLLKPHPAPQILPPPSFTESITENNFDNIRLVHSSSPLKHPVSLPTSILSSPLLKLLPPLSFAPNFPISSPLLHSPCIGTSLSPYNKLPMNEKLQSLSSSPYYSAPSQDMSSPPINPRELRNIVTPQVPPAFSQMPTNEAFVLVSKSEPPILPYILDNYIQLPPTNHEPKSKVLTSQGSLVKPSPILNYTQYAAPITSYIPSLEMPITPQYITPLTPAETLKKPLISPKYISSILPAQTTLQDSLPLNKALIHYQPYISPPTAFTSAAKNTFMSLPVALPYLPFDNMVEPVNTDLNILQSSLTPQYSVSVSTLPVSKSSPIVSHSNDSYCRISQHIPKQALTNHNIPSSLFMSTDIDFQTPKNKESPLHSIPRKSYPSLSLIEPLETVSFYTPSGPLGTTTNPQNILKTKSPLPSVQYTLPLSSAPYLTQPLQSIHSYQAQPLPNNQYTTKSDPKLSPVPALYTTPSSSPIYTSLSLETVPKQPVNKPSIPQYNLPSAFVYDSPIHSSSLARNPLINPDFQPVSVIPSSPVPKNIISLPKLIPSESILLSNLRPLDISQDSQNLHSPPITSSAPLTSSSLLKPLANKLPQKSRHYQPNIMPSNSQYVSQLPIDSVPQILPSTSPLLKSLLLKPLFTTPQNNVPLLPKHFSDTNTAFPEVFPIETVPSVTGPDIALSNYFLSDSSNHKYSGLYDSLVAEIPEIVAPINPSSITTNMPLYSNYDIQEPPPKLQIKANIINTANPVEVSVISASESSPLSLNALDTETIEDIERYELMPDLEDRFSQLPPNQNQQRQLYPILYPKYLPKPQLFHAKLPLLNRTPQMSPSKVPSFNATSLLSDATELVDTTDFIPISQIKSEPIMSNFAVHSSQPSGSSTDRKVPIPNTLSNIPELDILQLLPFTTFLNTDFPPPTYKQLPPKSLTPQYNNKIPQPSPIYLSPQEYKDLTQDSSASQKSSSSPSILSPTNIDPQLTTNPLTIGPHPQVSLYTSPMAITPDDWLQSRIFKNTLPVHEKLIEVTPEKESIPTILNKSKPANKITPQGNSYPYEPKSTISQIFSEFDSVKPVNPLLKSKEHYTEYIEDFKSNVYNDYDPKSDSVSSHENKPDVFEAKPTESLPEIIKGLTSISNYNNKAKSFQRLSKLDHYYVNNHMGKSPQIFNAHNYNISPTDSLTDVASPYTTMTPEILKDITNIPTRHFGSVPKLDTNFLRPNELYPEIADSPENMPTTNSYPQNYLNPCLKYSSQIKSPLNTVELADTSEMIPTSYSPYNNIDDIKYSGYKTYQIPSFKSPQTAHNLGTPTQRYSPSVLTSNKKTTPLQTKLGLDTLQETPELNEYYPTEDKTKNFDSINEDDELKTSLINYINKREDVKNNLLNNNAELTIPIGNIAISKKRPYNAYTIETNNPSIGLKVWKSKVKIVEPELKLKFKDLSVNNFMPIVNNLDKYDMEEIRKIVKNYIDEKYGNHIEVNEPYAIDNKYTVIKDFDHNVVDSKFNLLWPTNYV